MELPAAGDADRRADVSTSTIYIFWICVVIFIGVFGVMFYSLFKHRKSVGHQAAQFHENTHGRGRSGRSIPFLILLFMAYPATKTILAMKDTSRRT